MNKKMLNLFHELGLEEGDVVFYKKSKQIGIIQKVWSLPNGLFKYKIKLMKPDRVIWSNNKDELDILSCS